MGPNFDLSSRFVAADVNLILRILEASAVRPSDPRATRIPAIAAVRAAYARLRSRPWALSEDKTVAQFCSAVRSLTGQALTVDASDDGLLRWNDGSETWAYPPSPEKVLFFGFLTAVGPSRWLQAKYTCPGFVDLEPGDVVIDCGAFVGGFTRAALLAGASTVVSVEPSRTNQRCLRQNLVGQRVEVQTVGLGPTNTEAEFHESSTGVDSTFGQMDEGGATAKYRVEVVTVDELCRRTNVQPTFLKLEAEGMESAILRGMRHVRPRKVAIDASPEGGSDDRAAIIKILESRGYTVRTDVNMVYGRDL